MVEKLLGMIWGMLLWKCVVSRVTLELNNVFSNKKFKEVIKIFNKIFRNGKKNNQWSDLKVISSIILVIFILEEIIGNKLFYIVDRYGII